MFKAGFFFGAEGGSGVLLSKDAEGEWSYPAFYTIGGASFGLQIGAENSEVLFVILTDSGLESILNTSVKLGAYASIAIGPVGAGIEGATTTSFGADMRRLLAFGWAVRRRGRRRKRYLWARILERKLLRRRHDGAEDRPRRQRQKRKRGRASRRALWKIGWAAFHP